MPMFWRSHRCCQVLDMPEPSPQSKSQRLQLRGIQDSHNSIWVGRAHAIEMLHHLLLVPLLIDATHRGLPIHDKGQDSRVGSEDARMEFHIICRFVICLAKCRCGAVSCKIAKGPSSSADNRITQATKIIRIVACKLCTAVNHGQFSTLEQQA